MLDMVYFLHLFIYLFDAQNNSTQTRIYENKIDTPAKRRMWVYCIGTYYKIVALQ